MLWLTMLGVWCASGCARGAVPARDKPFYPEAAHAQIFEEFKTTHHKQYASPEEERHRFEIFKSNLNRINENNEKFKETVHDVNKFTDLTTQEFVAQYTGLLVDKNRKPRPPPPFNLSSIEVPDAFDWRDKNVVARVKDQGGCGSCWAFGITACLESHYAMKNKKLVEFSESQLVDCDIYDYGCGGGDPINAISYMLHHGVMTEAEYPYKEQAGKCKYDPNKAVAHVKDFYSYNYVDEKRIKELLYSKGPMLITIDASPLQSYGSGIIRDCKHLNTNHAVFLVGYGIEHGVKYWLIKNSWGDGFGEKGYFKMQRDKACLGFTEAAGTEAMLVIV